MRRKLALCAGTTERRDFSASASANGSGTLHLASLERSYDRVHVGPTYGLALGRRVAVGGSLHLVDTRVTSLTTADLAGAETSAFSASTQATSFDLALLLGATFRLDSATTLGIAFAPPSVHVIGTADAADHSESGEIARTRTASGSFSAPLPMRAAVGIGTQTSRVKVTADATFFFPTDSAFQSQTDVRTVGPSDTTESVRATTRANAVLDSALGIELFLSDTISVLGGAAVDFGATPPLSAAPPIGTVVTTREDRVMTTLGLGSYGGGSELLFGTQLAFARGETLVGDNFASPNVLAPVTQRSTTFLFVVAGSTSLSTLRRTFDDIRKIR
jgi:hypothetical protein